MFNTLNIYNNRCSKQEIESMRKFRALGLTLSSIASGFGRTIPTVFRHTKCIPHANRHAGNYEACKRTGRAA